MWRWIRTYWYVPVILITVVVTWVLGRRRGQIQSVLTEWGVFRAGLAARRLEVETDADTATERIRTEYAAKTEALDVGDRAKVEALSGDPVGLAVLLERLSR